MTRTRPIATALVALALAALPALAQAKASPSETLTDRGSARLIAEKLQKTYGLGGWKIELDRSASGGRRGFTATRPDVKGAIIGQMRQLRGDATKGVDRVTVSGRWVNAALIRPELDRQQKAINTGPSGLVRGPYRDGMVRSIESIRRGEVIGGRAATGLVTRALERDYGRQQRVALTGASADRTERSFTAVSKRGDVRTGQVGMIREGGPTGTRRVDVTPSYLKDSAAKGLVARALNERFGPRFGVASGGKTTLGPLQADGTRKFVAVSVKGDKTRVGTIQTLKGTRSDPAGTARVAIRPSRAQLGLDRPGGGGAGGGRSSSGLLASSGAGAGGGLARTGFGSGFGGAPGRLPGGAPVGAGFGRGPQPGTGQPSRR